MEFKDWIAKSTLLEYNWLLESYGRRGITMIKKLKYSVQRRMHLTLYRLAHVRKLVSLIKNNRVFN